MRRVLAGRAELRIFSDGSEVLEALETEPPPDALLLDWQMPGVSGPEACRYLRGRPATQHLGILLLTSNQRPEDVAAGLDAGANDYLVKPYQDVELVARVMALVRTQQLRERAERAEAAAQDRRLDFYSSATHDLRSPLQVILLKLQGLRAGRRGPLTAEQKTEIQLLEVRVTELGSMVGEFLDLATLDAGGIQVDALPVELSALVEVRVSDFAQLAEQKGIQLTMEPGDPVEIAGDPRRLAQVVTNLVSNALKFTAPGGQVRVRVRQEGAWALTEVEDTGSGISPDALPTLFDRFTRATAHRAVEGTGLGLTITREIVEAHGGTVGVRSEVGQGSTFWFRILAAATPRP